MLGTAYPHQKRYPQYETSLHTNGTQIILIQYDSPFSWLPLTTINQLIFDIGYIGSL